MNPPAGSIILSRSQLMMRAQIDAYVDCGKLGNHFFSPRKSNAEKLFPMHSFRLVECSEIEVGTKSALAYRSCKLAIFS